jgi:hypothetical protein
MLVYDVRLPKDRRAATFERFMRDAYIPAVHKSPTRVGQVNELMLLRCEPTSTRHKFLWLVDWSGLPNGQPMGVRVDDEKVSRKFEAFGATVKRLDAWDEVGRWRPSDA